jgi:predicted nucleic acid-binding protein
VEPVGERRSRLVAEHPRLQLLRRSPSELDPVLVAGVDADPVDAETFGHALRNVRITEATCRAAIAAMAELTVRGSDGYHRVKPPDPLIAASAQEASIGALHYDHDFDRLAEVLAFERRWLAPPGTFD